jgi:predicted dehydrogenase
MTRRYTRRTFLTVSTAAAAGLLTRRRTSANDVSGKLRLAAIGTGNKGGDDLREISASPRVEVAAICDVDSSPAHLGWAAEQFPRAARFADYRRLFDKPDSFDAVSVSTPDHMHAPIALAAMALGKHVFCQKPLTHTVHEARQMREAAERHRLVTQMGNQIQSHSVYRTAVQLLRDGAIGKVREVHSWQAGGMGWLLAEKRPSVADPIPSTLNWDMWLGVAPERHFNARLYHPFNWRAWQDFSSGQLGDFGCHILDPVFMGLGLTAPISVEAEAPPLNDEVWAPRAKVSYRFPGTDRTVAEELPVTWYDGDRHQPQRAPLGVPRGYRLPGSGSALVGEAGTMVIPHWDVPRLFPEEKFREFEIPKLEDVNHYTGWVDACLGDGTTTSNFGYAGPLTEAVLLGAVAIRFPGVRLEWDAQAAQIANHAEANARLTKEYRPGWG